MEFITEFYLWIRVIHIVAVIAWMAGLFYLPRLFVYHTEFPENGKMLEIMEEKLSKIIMLPAMCLAISTGLLLMLILDTIKSPWFHAKLTCVFLLVVFNLYLDAVRKQLKNSCCNKSSKFFRIINEIPTVLLILIIIFAVMKPF